MRPATHLLIFAFVAFAPNQAIAQPLWRLDADARLEFDWFTEQRSSKSSPHGKQIYSESRRIKARLIPAAAIAGSGILSIEILRASWQVSNPEFSLGISYSAGKGAPKVTRKAKAPESGQLIEQQLAERLPLFKAPLRLRIVGDRARIETKMGEEWTDIAEYTSLLSGCYIQSSLPPGGLEDKASWLAEGVARLPLLRGPSATKEPPHKLQARAGSKGEWTVRGRLKNAFRSPIGEGMKGSNNLSSLYAFSERGFIERSSMSLKASRRTGAGKDKRVESFTSRQNLKIRLPKEKKK